jgi:flagellar biosynthesis protein FlhB
MVGPGFVFVSLFIVIFGIVYLYFSTRNKERLALIEKGADASIFVRGRTQKAAPIWKILILNLALLLMGIGLGIIVAGILSEILLVKNEIAFPGCIFLLAGAALFIGFKLTKNLDREMD